MQQKKFKQILGQVKRHEAEVEEMLRLRDKAKRSPSASNKTAHAAAVKKCAQHPAEHEALVATLVSKEEAEAWQAMMRTLEPGTPAFWADYERAKQAWQSARERRGHTMRAERAKHMRQR